MGCRTLLCHLEAVVWGVKPRSPLGGGAVVWGAMVAPSSSSRSGSRFCGSEVHGCTDFELKMHGPGCRGGSQALMSMSGAVGRVLIRGEFWLVSQLHRRLSCVLLNPNHFLDSDALD